MYSSEDFERFYFQYQTEALPHGESLQSFCVKNKVPYNIFQKWYNLLICVVNTAVCCLSFVNDFTGNPVTEMSLIIKL